MWERLAGVGFELDHSRVLISTLILQILAGQMSSRLYHSTGGVLTINHYNILLPENWSKSSACLQSRTVTQASINPKLADIFVTKSFAKTEPWAIQYGK